MRAKKWGKYGRRGGLACLVIWSLFPVYWALNTSLQTNSEAQSTPVHFFPTHPQFSNYEAIFGFGPSSAQAAGGIGRTVVNVAVESLGATILTLVIAVVGAYAFARLRFRFRGVMFYAVLATLTLPAYATLIPIYRILTDAHLVNTYTGIILVYTSGFLPLAMWIMYNIYLALPPSIEEAATVDGATTLQVFRKIVLPIVRPGIAAAAIITFLFGWGQFIFPLVLASSSSTEPLTVSLSALEGRHVVPYTIINAAAIVAIAIPAVIVFVLNRWIVDGLVAGSVK
ncbi:MAG: carbohydrate ABC transporter permease [Solirubrobacteraceae bacterium]